MPKSIEKASALQNNERMKKRKKNLTSEPTIEADQTRPAIDYPREGDNIQEGYYAVRITASPDSEVEISINAGDWLPCRQAAGHWWFDWNPTESFSCKLVVRSRTGKNSWVKSNERSCKITNPN